MSRTTGRTLALLGLLQARREWSGAELCARLEVSERTLRRDIDDLRALGYGINASRGMHGGYRLGPGAAVPPLTLSGEEAVAIAVGLRAAALGAVTGLEEAAARALTKLEQSLGPATREQILEVEQAIVPLGPGRDPLDFEVLLALARAIRDSHRVQLDYTRHDGERIRRDIEPHRIVHTVERWYLVARDVQRRAWRTLRIDRIDAVRALREAFTPSEIPEDQLRDFTSRSISTAPYRHRLTLRMYAPAAVVTRAFGPTVARVQDCGDGTSMLETGSDSLEEIALYVGLSGLGFELADADSLRPVLVRLVEQFTGAIGESRPPVAASPG